MVAPDGGALAAGAARTSRRRSCSCCHAPPCPVSVADVVRRRREARVGRGWCVALELPAATPSTPSDVPALVKCGRAQVRRCAGGASTCRLVGQRPRWSRSCQVYRATLHARPSWKPRAIGRGGGNAQARTRRRGNVSQHREQQLLYCHATPRHAAPRLATPRRVLLVRTWHTAPQPVL